MSIETIGGPVVTELGGGPTYEPPKEGYLRRFWRCLKE